MKNIFKYAFFALVLLSGTGCQKWLDINPKTKVSERILFENEQGFKDALTGVYVQMASRSLYSKEFTMGLMDVFARNYDVSLNSSSYYQAGLYNFKDINVKNKIDAFWNSGYKAIANLNNLLEQIETKKRLFSGDNYAIIKGEALGLRAYIHFDLLRAFGPVITKGLDQIAIPYVKEFDMTTKPSLKAGEVIENCLDDLTQATELLKVRKQVVYGDADIFLSNTRNHMNYWGATGLMARIYLYKGDHTNAYTKSKEVIDSKLFPFVTSSSLSGMFPSRTFTSEHLFALYVSNLQEINAELFKTSAATAMLTNRESFINSRFEIATGGSTDFRYLYLWKTDGASATKFPAKYWQDDISSTGNLIRRVPLLRLSEMYYIAAESVNSTSEKIGFINEVRRNRGLSMLQDTLDLESIQIEIKKEYQKEFYQEGQLFFFYKRLNYPTIEGYGFPMTESIYVLPRPDDEIEFNN